MESLFIFPANPYILEGNGFTKTNFVRAPCNSLQFSKEEWYNSVNESAVAICEYMPFILLIITSRNSKRVVICKIHIKQTLDVN